MNRAASLPCTGAMTDPHPEPRVQFLIAGVQKGGTTALADYLRQHPQLHSHFQDAPAGCLWGEATPIYSYWWPAMARIWAYNPAMQLILCLRNPIETA